MFPWVKRCDRVVFCKMQDLKRRISQCFCFLLDMEKKIIPLSNFFFLDIVKNYSPLQYGDEI